MKIFDLILFAIPPKNFLSKDFDWLRCDDDMMFSFSQPFFEEINRKMCFQFFFLRVRQQSMAVRSLKVAFLVRSFVLREKKVFRLQRRFSQKKSERIWKFSSRVSRESFHESLSSFS